MIRPLILMTCLGLWGCTSADGNRLRIFAAASAVGLAEAVAADYRQQTGLAVSVNVAATSTLARQIQQGAPGDLFIAAHPRWVDALDSSGLVSRRQPWLRNRLVLIGHGPPAETTATGRWPSSQALQTGRLAIADPSHVPAGEYAGQVLRKLGIWNEVQPALMPAQNVRTALQWVLVGEARYGLVYATDVPSDAQCHVVIDIPAGWHDPIIYELAVVGEMTPMKKRAFAFWTSPSAYRIGQLLGFMPMDQGVVEP